MIRLLTITITVLMLAVVSFTAPAHATGMAVSMNVAGGLRHGDHAAEREAACHHDKTCKAESGLCDLVCMGAGVFLPPERVRVGMIVPRETYHRHPGAILVATPPGLDDRPPITHRL